MIGSTPDGASVIDPRIGFHNDELVVHFRQFDPSSYNLFLQVKRLPEYQVEFDSSDETYRIKAPARFAALLGVKRPAPDRKQLPIASHLYDDQVAIVGMALDAKRFACWSDCGLGKTAIFLEWARHVIHRTNKRVLIVTLNEIIEQTIKEARSFYGEALPIHRISTRQEMRDWCREPGPGLAITNYEKWNPESLQEQVVSEARYLGGIVLDEASRLRTGGGKQKWALIHSCKGIEYKLTCTATPAPNDVMEFASQASFLEKMRSESEILWTYFTRDSITHRWTVKEHARSAFFEFMSNWSIYVRDPRRYGWRKNLVEVPEPEMIVHELEATPEQMDEYSQICGTSAGQRSFLDGPDTNAIQRNKLSQVAKGFRYETPDGSVSRQVKRIPSLKPEFVADLIRSEAEAGHHVLVWTVYDAESCILADLLGNSLEYEVLTGKTPKAKRISKLERFCKGESPVLISRASMLGYGLNFQNCGSMIFSGYNDSYESFYQAIRRAVRQGQSKRVRVHLPCVKFLEDDTLENLYRKQANHEAAIAEMERNYISFGHLYRQGVA